MVRLMVNTSHSIRAQIILLRMVVSRACPLSDPVLPLRSAQKTLHSTLRYVTTTPSEKVR